jgi:hypothetical protein
MPGLDPLAPALAQYRRHGPPPPPRRDNHHARDPFADLDLTRSSSPRRYSRPLLFLFSPPPPHNYRLHSPRCRALIPRPHQRGTNFKGEGVRRDNRERERGRANLKARNDAVVVCQLPPPLHPPLTANRDDAEDVCSELPPFHCRSRPLLLPLPPAHQPTKVVPLGLRLASA